MLLPSGSPSYLCVRFITCFYIYLILTYKIGIQAGFPLTKDPQFQVVENYSELLNFKYLQILVFQHSFHSK